MYRDCHKDYKTGGGLHCDRNVECVITPGNKWCTGPKIDNCYVYDAFIFKKFVKAVKVNRF
jgi:hypothetical protein